MSYNKSKEDKNMSNEKKNYPVYPPQPRPEEERTPYGDIPDTYGKTPVADYHGKMGHVDTGHAPEAGK